MATDEELEREIVEYQKMEKQLEAVMGQRYQLETQREELTTALKLIEKTSEEVYKSSGGILVKVSREEAIKDIKDKLELIEVRLKTLKDQEDGLKNKLERLMKKLQEELKHRSGPGEAA
ncbi:MAG: prefoldin subunit beta [Candidatus Anstonellales archaeon]